VVDISHPEFEDHIASVNQTLLDIKANDKPVIMVFNKIDAYQHLTIDEDDLMTEKTPRHYTLEEWKATWMSQGRRKCIVYFGYTKKISKSLENACTSGKIHITRFPTTNSCIGLQRRGRERRKKTKKKTNNVLLHKI
jgi:GTP-binding protein HflX